MAPYTILLTGANSGLGFSTCCRLMDEFLSTRPASQTLHLLFTTRSPSKSEDTLTRLTAHLDRTIASVYGSEAKTASIRQMQKARVKIESEEADLCDLASVKRLAGRVRGRGQKVDCLICNAGIGGWEGLHWGQAMWGVCTDIFEATTFPWYKRGMVGRRVKWDGAEKGGKGDEKDVSGEEEPVLGETFTANVFGHYMLVHWLTEVLVRREGEGSRVVWVSSIEAFDKFFDVEDLQGLKVGWSYESSKRLTDLLVLTSEEPSTRRYVEEFFSFENGGKESPKMRVEGEGVLIETEEKVKPKMYVSHPGVCVTSISGIHWLLVYLNIAALYMVRWLGSPWHPISSYIAAVSTVWIALADTETLAKLEGEEGKGKWGAATDRMGGERVVRTEVDGWGWGGKPGETTDGVWRLEARKGKNRVHTKEEREEFEVKGAQVWKAMETLRKDWERRLQDS
ncbi:hypothetical protein KVT40_005443 [Elsinoe batatas]|uniref:3-keto-steroid reductase n=1 Tax=Elsinoe batatas TaxID=2601811 RepID=A0A8K0L683_9PEZI|nr:hypothetical protein KVT40_005443 [Elsinoe batatas]